MIRGVFERWALPLALMFSFSHPSASGRNKQGVIVRNPIKVAGSGRKVIVTIAPAVEQALHRHFPGFRVTDFGDFSPDITSALTEREPKLFVPFACVGDFDGDGLPDVALLLKDRRRYWLLVAFHQTYQGTFRPYRVEPWQSYRDQLIDTPGKFYFFIEALPLKKYAADALPLRHNDPRDGIHMVWAESASRLFYFRKGRYRYLQTSD